MTIEMFFNLTLLQMVTIPDTINIGLLPRIMAAAMAHGVLILALDLVGFGSLLSLLLVGIIVTKSPVSGVFARIKAGYSMIPPKPPPPAFPRYDGGTGRKGRLCTGPFGPERG